METRYYIKIPSSSGIPGQFVRVDPQTLHHGILTQLFTLDPRTKRYVAVRGIDHVVKTNVDVSSLADAWDGLRGMIEMATVSEGIAGEFSKDIRGLLSEMPQLLELVADGQLAEAEKVLESLAYRLLAATGTATTNLAALEAKANDQGNIAESMVGIVINAEDRNLNEAFEFADAVHAGLSAYSTLAGHEQELESLFERLEPMYRSWQALTSANANSSWMREQLEWLDHIQTGFCARVSRFMFDPDSASEATMAAALEEAISRMAQVAHRLETAVGEHAEARVRVDKLLECESVIDSHIRTMRSAREIVERSIKSGIDAFAVQSQLVTSDEFDKWQSLLQDRQWQSLHDIGARFRHLAESLRRLLDQTPSLDAKTQKVCAAVEHRIEQLENKLTEPDSQSEQASELLSLHPAAMPKEDDQPDAAAAPALTELYELILAVAAVKYCGEVGRPTVMTLNSVLKILEQMGRTTHQERAQYATGLQELIDNHSFDLDLSPDRFKRRTDAWLELTPDEAHWITFRQGRGARKGLFRYWRMIDQLRERGLQLCITHGITSEDVLEAYEAIKQERPRRSA